MNLPKLVASALSAAAVLVAAPKADAIYFGFGCWTRVNHYQVSGGGVHVVKQGDTLSGIAQHYYTDWQNYKMLAFENNLANPDLIHPGNVISLPLKTVLVETTYKPGCEQDRLTLNEYTYSR